MFFCSGSFLIVENDEYSEYLKQIGILVEKHRIAQKLTKVQLAFELGTNESYIRRVEKGQKNITVKTLLRLAIALNTSPDNLLPHNKGK